MKKKLPGLELILLSVIVSGKGLAQWGSNPALNTPVSIVAQDQRNVDMCSDTKRGAIVAWRDARADSINTQIYAQRIDSGGYVLWTTNGLGVCTGSGRQTSVSITEDGNGGALLAWTDYRSVVPKTYAQKIDAAGNLVWASTGVAASSAASYQKNPRLVNDGAGGAIIVWEDSALVNSWNIFAQRISAAGAIMWAAGGVAVCNIERKQLGPKIQPDGAGGAFIVWQDRRSNIDYDVYAQRVNTSGSVMWTANGALVSNAAGNQESPKVKPDYTGGIIVGWEDKRNSALKNANVYAQRIDAAGVMQWAANGVTVCNADSTQKNIDIVTYEVYGAIFSWQDKRSGEYQIYSQKLNLAGVQCWAPDGIPVAASTTRQYDPSGVGDMYGGAILTWQDSAAGGWDIKSQRLDYNGSSLWASGGIPVATAAGDQIEANGISDGIGGCIYSWQDGRSATDDDIYAHHLFWNGTLNGVSEPVLTVTKCYPNPLSSKAVIEIPQVLGEIQFSALNLLGEKVAFPYYLGQEGVYIDRGALQNGVYFYEIATSSGQVLKGKLILTD